MLNTETAKLMRELATNHQRFGHPYPQRAVILEKIATHLRLSPDLVDQSPTLQSLLNQLDH